MLKGTQSHMEQLLPAEKNTGYVIAHSFTDCLLTAVERMGPVIIYIYIYIQ